ncbi:hypothetical protein CN527_10230 [Bacillus cereus]|nr:hypothetical protein CN527_10230 [Bacillus cereus]PGN92688.1 hypothetical protein CN976_23175 [Bacillus cereus]
MTVIIGVNQGTSLLICADKRRSDLMNGYYTDDAVKIYELNNNILLALAGNVAVTDVLIRNLKIEEDKTIDEVISYIRSEVNLCLSIAREKALKGFKGKKKWYQRIFYRPSPEEQEYLDNVIDVAYILAGFDSSKSRVLYKFTSENQFQEQLQPVNSPAIIGSGQDKVEEFFLNKKPSIYSLTLCEQAIAYASKHCKQVSAKTYHKKM